jgi:hypothetical protein
MKNSRQLLWVFATLGLSLLVMLSYDIIESSIAQQQNETTNQAQMQSQENNMSETKFLKNNTSFGNATADLRIKHAPEFSTLTIQPWPIVEPSKEFNITGILADKITLEPIANSDVSFLYESASEAIPPFSLETIDKQTADTDGKFNATATAPDTQGIVSVTAVYNGSGLYHSVASDPALVIVSNSTLPP